MIDIDPVTFLLAAVDIIFGVLCMGAVVTHILTGQWPLNGGGRG